MKIDTQDWYVIYTYPNREKKVYDELRKRQIEAFLPLQTVVRQWSDRKKKMEVPLFPSYLFVNIFRKDQWNVLDTSGVSKFITVDGEPVALQDDEIDKIRAILQRNPEISDYRFQQGDTMKITSGPLMGLQGQIIDFKGKYRMLIKVDVIDQHLLVDVDASHLEMMQPFESCAV